MPYSLWYNFSNHFNENSGASQLTVVPLDRLLSWRISLDGTSTTNFHLFFEHFHQTTAEANAVQFFSIRHKFSTFRQLSILLNKVPLFCGLRETQNQKCTTLPVPISTSVFRFLTNRWVTEISFQEQIYFKPFLISVEKLYTVGLGN